MDKILHQLRSPKYTIIYKVLYIPGGGFCPSTVWLISLLYEMAHLFLGHGHSLAAMDTSSPNLGSQDWWFAQQVMTYHDIPYIYIYIQESYNTHPPKDTPQYSIEYSWSTKDFLDGIQNISKFKMLDHVSFGMIQFHNLSSQDGCPWQENRICRVYHLEVEKYPTPKCWGLLGGYMIGLCTRGMWDLVLFETLNSTRYKILWTRGFCDVLWCPTRVFHASTKPRGAWLLIATVGCSYPWCFNEFGKWAIFHLSPLPTHSIHGTGRSTCIYQM